MNENQQPLTEKQTAAPAESVPETPADAEAMLPAEPDGEVPAETDDDAVEAAEEEEIPEEEDIDPADVHIFGMPRVCFHYTAFGVAGGYILSGLLGIAGLDTPDATICAIAVGAVGYFLGKRVYKKRKAERDAAAEAAQATETEQTAE